MAKSDAGSTREERLAAQLRENLKRRKAQARAMERGSPEGSGGGSAKAPGAGDSTLPKAAEDS